MSNQIQISNFKQIVIPTKVGIQAVHSLGIADAT